MPALPGSILSTPRRKAVADLRPAEWHPHTRGISRLGWTECSQTAGVLGERKALHRRNIARAVRKDLLGHHIDQHHGPLGTGQPRRVIVDGCRAVDPHALAGTVEADERQADTAALHNIAESLAYAFAAIVVKAEGAFTGDPNKARHTAFEGIVDGLAPDCRRGDDRRIYPAELGYPRETFPFGSLACRPGHKASIATRYIPSYIALFRSPYSLGQ